MKEDDGNPYISMGVYTNETTDSQRGNEDNNENSSEENNEMDRELNERAEE